MERTLQLVVHGRGNAWPVPLGETHPFYKRNEPRDLSNASFSLITYGQDRITADVLIDAGHGTIQSLISGSNRIPDCICLTHGHMDHTLSVDWIVQSYWRRYNKERRYPIYATLPVFRSLEHSYPHLEGLLELKELIPGVTRRMDDAHPFRLTAYPVYHGKSAAGAAMLLFETEERRVLFTGDLLSPLLRIEDYHHLKELDLLVVDTNNRFPWPRTNHWSFTGHPTNPSERSQVLTDFLDNLSWEDVTLPHELSSFGETTLTYFRQLKEEWNSIRQPFTLLEFLMKIEPRKIVPVHYSGAEDLKYNSESILSANELYIWLTQTAKTAGLSSLFMVPETGQIITV